MRRCLRELSAQRDAAARREAAQSSHLRAAREALAVRDLELRDAQRAAREALTRKACRMLPPSPALIHRT